MVKLLSAAVFFWTYTTSAMFAQTLNTDSLRKEVQLRTEKYLIKDDSVRNHFDIRDEGIYIFASSRHKAADSAEFFMTWREVAIFNFLQYYPIEDALKEYQAKGTKAWKMEDAERIYKRAWPDPSATPEDKLRPLQNLRVAIDPGHIGGTMEMAITERKFIKMRASDHPEAETDIEFNEGNLALATALLLRDTLEAQGATVMLTREKPGYTAFGNSYQEWRKKSYNAAVDTLAKRRNLSPAEKNKLRNPASEKDAFYGVFSIFDLEERARRINAFMPDATVIIHYNVKESNTPDKDWCSKPTEDNYCMSFVPGAYMEGELNDPRKRLEFLFKLVKNHIPASLAFSDIVTREMETVCGVPACVWDDSLKYLDKSSIETEYKGVYCRNLGLCRMVHGTLCFGEGLLQDNVKESVALNRKDFEIGGIMAPNRIRDFATAYYNAIVKWYHAE